MSGEVVRLFAVEGRTELERANTRRLAKRAQGALFEVVGELDAVPVCPVCAGDHGGVCRHGVALTLGDAS